MGVYDFSWSIIYGKVVFNESLVKAVSRGLLPSLRAACVVSPSLQNLSLLALLKQSLAPTSPSFSEPPKKKSRSLSVTADRAVPDGLSDANKYVLEASIWSFVEQVAAWTEDEKERQMQLLNRADVIVKREQLACELKLTDFNVQDDEDECWKACESSDSLSDDYDFSEDFSIYEKVENATGEFEVIISQLSTALRGAISENICYKTASWDAHASRSASILTIDAKIVSGGAQPGDMGSGVAVFKVRPGFFDVSPHDERSLKFASNLLGLDDSAKTIDLQDADQPSPHGYYGANRFKAGEVGPTSDDDDDDDDDDDGMPQMEGNEPAWFTVQSMSFG